MIKNLIPRLAERGRIKIGEKGEMKTSQGGKEFALPKKLDHIVITTMQRDAAGRLMPDTDLMAQINPGGGKLVEIPIRLLYDDIDLNFFTRYACYKGNRCWCSGDGEEASRITGENGNYKPVSCPCERQDPMYQGSDKCKTLGTLSALIEGVNRVAVYSGLSPIIALLMSNVECHFNSFSSLSRAFPSTTGIKRRLSWTGGSGCRGLALLGLLGQIRRFYRAKIISFPIFVTD